MIDLGLLQVAQARAAMLTPEIYEEKAREIIEQDLCDSNQFDELIEE